MAEGGGGRFLSTMDPVIDLLTINSSKDSSKGGGGKVSSTVEQVDVEIDDID